MNATDRVALASAMFEARQAQNDARRKAEAVTDRRGRTFMVGTRVTYAGFPGAVYEIGKGQLAGMAVVARRGGQVCVPLTDLELV